MKVAELEELARMKKMATKLLTGKSPKIEVEVGGQKIACAGERARDIGAGIMLCVRAMENVPVQGGQIIH